MTSSKPSASVTAAPELSFAEFDPTTYAAWTATVTQTTAWERLHGRVDDSGDGGVRTAPLFEPAQTLAPAPAPCVGGAWRVAQEYGLRSPAAAAEAIAVDRGYGLGAAWIRLAPSLRARAAVDDTSGGMQLCDREGAKALVAGAGDTPVYVEAGANGVSSLSLMLEAYGEPTAVKGGVLCDPLGTLAGSGGLGMALAEAWTQVGRVFTRAQLEAPELDVLLCSGVPYHSAGASVSVELGAIVATLLASLRGVREAGIDPAAAWRRTLLRCSAEADVFVGIAKVRALRLLTTRLVATVLGAGAAPPRITVRTSQRDRTRHDPWVNMLRTTTEVFGAAVGGAFEVTAQPFSEPLGAPDADARRWALTTAHILRDESHLARSVDPAAGSGYVESLTDSFARRAWAEVQAIEAAGGMASALQGHVQDRIAASAAPSVAALATGKRALTGVSIFPDLDERTLAVAPDPPWPSASMPTGDAVTTVTPLAPLRLSVPFERLREGSKRALDKHGARPVVTLLALGEQREHRARLDFAQAAVRVGGFEPRVLADAASLPKGAGWVLIIASDERLASEGPAAIETARAAGAQAVWVARAPVDTLSPDGFLHLATDVPAAMAQLHDLLGVGR